MNKKQKKELARILTAAAMMIAMHFAPVSGLWRLAFYLVPYGIISYDILYKAMRGIRNRQVFDENFLMSIASIGAFLLAVYDGSGDYAEAVAVMLFYKVGELFESYAVGRSRRNISELMDIRPDYANIQQEDGSLARVAPDEVSIGSVIVVARGKGASGRRGAGGAQCHKFRGAHGRKQAPQYRKGAGYCQRLHKYDRAFEGAYHKGL